MIETQMYFICACVSGLAQYGALLLNQDSKDKVWKRGLYVGAIGSGYAACGFPIPAVNPWPCLSFFVAMAIMLCCVLASYLLAPIPDSYSAEQREDRTETRQSAIKQLVAGVGITLVMATVIAFVQGQQDGQRVQMGFAGVVYRLADEVKSLHEAVTVLTDDVKQLKAQAKIDARKDSIARAKNFKNQEILINQKRR